MSRSETTETSPIKAICRKCRCVQPCQVIPGPFGPHYAKALCSRCGTFVKWVKKTLVIEWRGN